MARRKKSNNRKPWGIYVYIAGDNNLSDNGLKDIVEMTKAGASKDVHVAVQIDTRGDYDGTVRYEISEPDFAGASHRIVIERFAEQNTGDPVVLANFAAWGANRYPASKRVLVVWNHGAGFMHEPTRDIAYDDSSRGDALTMAELRWALEKAGFGKKAGTLSILGFDACLMNMVEVAYEFGGLTRYVVGSQQTEPADGWPYDRIVARAKAKTTPKAMAAGIVSDYVRSYRAIGTRGITQSAVDVAKLAAVGKAVDSLGGILLARVGASRTEILQARVGAQGYEEPTYVDLADLMKRIQARLPDARVRAACARVKQAVKMAVLAKGSLGGSVNRSAGLSIWFPLVKTDYATRRSEYMALKYTADYPAWAAFLDALLAV